MLAEWQRGRYPSLELLWPEALPLSPHAHTLLAVSDTEAEWLRNLRPLFLSNAPPVVAAPETFGTKGAEFNWSPFSAYATACYDAGQILPPPVLPFD